jgi:hypothetical protein
VASKGYCLRSHVADELGVVLTAQQELQVDALIEAAEDAIDDLAAQEWLGVSPVTAELHTPSGDYLNLEHRPVTAVTTVTTRAPVPGETAETLVASSDYELVDAARGVLLLPGKAGQLVSVAYTYAAPVPPAIRQATALLVAEWFRPRLNGSSGAAVESLTVGDVSVKYGKAASTENGGVPARVRDLVMNARRPIFL